MKHKKPHIYILHGWSVDAKNEKKWAEFRSQLESKGITSTFVGLPGLTIPLNSVWRLENFVAWLSETLPKEPVFLLGHSFGGQLAVRYASVYPEKVEQLVLIDSSGIRDRSLVAQTKRTVFFALAKLGKLFAFLPFARAFLYRLARERDYFEAPLLLRQTMANVISEEIIDDLEKVSAPTVVIWGEKDSITPLENVEYFKKIPNVSVQTIPEARHSPQFTHSARVAEIIEKFISKS